MLYYIASVSKRAIFIIKYLSRYQIRPYDEITKEKGLKPAAWIITSS
jgi:hypothetical protein